MSAALRLPLIACFACSALLAAAARAEEAPAKGLAPAKAGAAVLVTALGGKGIDILHRRGYVSVAGDSKRGRRLLHVQWDTLNSLAGHAPAWQAFLDVYERSRDDAFLASDLPKMRPLQRLPAAGFLNTPVRAALDILATHLSEGRALGKRRKAGLERTLLYDTEWGRPFRERTRTELLTDPAPLARDFFQRHLTAPEEMPAPVAHFLEHMKEVRGRDVSDALRGDRIAGTLSKGTADAIAVYLLDQKRLWNVSRTPRRLRALERGSTLRRDLSELRYVVELLAAKPGIPKAAALALKGRKPEQRIRFSVPELHVHNEDHSGSLDVGDTAVVSVAYWVYGLGPDNTAQVTELGFVDRGELGVTDRVQKTVERRNGGPYVFSAAVPIRSADPLTFRVYFDGDGAQTQSRKIEIAVEKDYSTFLSRAADAEAEAASCRLAEAKSRFESLEKDLVPVEKKRRQLGRLLSTVRDRLKLVSGQAAELERLRKALDSARLYASSEQCSFDKKRAEAALALLARLPAGCDDAPESSGDLSRVLRRLFRETEERHQRQLAFRKAASEARDLERRCRPAEAAKLYASALALMDGAPESRCGEWEREYTAVRLTDLPRVLSAGTMARTLDKALQRSSRLFAKEDYGGALRILTPLIAGIDGMPDAECYAKQSAEAERLAEAAGVALGPDEPTALSRTLPKDAVKKEAAQVEKEWDRFERKSKSERQREWLRQSPHAPQGGAR